MQRDLKEEWYGRVYQEGVLAERALIMSFLPFFLSSFLLSRLMVLVSQSDRRGNLSLVRFHIF